MSSRHYCLCLTSWLAAMQPGMCMGFYEFMCVAGTGLVGDREKCLGGVPPQLPLKTSRCHGMCCVTCSTCCHLAITSAIPLLQRILLHNTSLISDSVLPSLCSRVKSSYIFPAPPWLFRVPVRISLDCVPHTDSTGNISTFSCSKCNPQRAVPKDQG